MLFILPSNHLYLYCNKFNLRTQSQQFNFEARVEIHINKLLCRELLSVHLDRSILFFTREPTTQDDFFDLLVGIIDIEDLYIHNLCANRAGSRILEEYVFPRIPVDDFDSRIILQPLYEAIVFYLKNGFEFENEYLQRMFTDLLSKYHEKEITETIKDISEGKREFINREYYNLLKKYINYMESDDINTEMYWERKKVCYNCKKQAEKMCSKCQKLICGEKCWKFHNCV